MKNEELKLLNSTLVIGFEVLVSVAMKSCIFWDIPPYSPLKVGRPSGCYLLYAGFFDSEGEGKIFLRNVGWL
jgi:hypothetical protein